MKRLALAAVLVLVAGTAHAERSEGVIWLMDQPASLFDWGMRSIDEHADTVKEYATKPAVASKVMPDKHVVSWTRGGYYNLKTNQIVISFSIHALKPELRKGEACFAALNALRNLFFQRAGYRDYDANNDEQRVVYAQKLMGRFFSHEGIIFPNRPANIGEELANMTVFEVAYTRREGLPGISCTVPLAGNAITVNEEGKQPPAPVVSGTEPVPAAPAMPAEPAETAQATE